MEHLRGFKRRLFKKKDIAPAVPSQPSPPTTPSRGLPSEPSAPETNLSQLNLSPPIDPEANPSPPQSSSPQPSETKSALLGGFKTLLELGALVSQGLPTQIPKAVLESISYMIKVAEVGTDFLEMTIIDLRAEDYSWQR